MAAVEQSEVLHNSGSYYYQVVNHPIVQRALSTYDWAKTSHPYIESTLDNVEQRVAGISQVANQKANETYEALVQKAFSTYDWAKTSHPYIESTLDNVEQHIAGFAQVANQKTRQRLTEWTEWTTDLFLPQQTSAQQ